MDDAGDDASSTGSNDVAVTEDQIQYILAEEAGPSVQRLTGPNPEEVLMPLGIILGDSASQLRALLNARRWLEAADHVAKCLLFHKGAPGLGPAADDMLPEHPELIIVLRRQHALELLGEGKREEALDYYNHSIFAASRLANRTPHLDALISDLGAVIAAAAPPPAAAPPEGQPDAAAPPPPPGGQPANLPPLDLFAERRTTHTHVRDYLTVYFPDFDRREMSSVLYAAAPFGEVMGGKVYRCLVCHEELSFRTAPDQYLTEHLHYHCPAVTPALGRRLPRRNRPPWHAPSAAAAAKRGRRK